jgi:hypothetical protein
MDNETLDELLARLEHTRTWTLRGGNDPDDKGNVRQAVAELCDLVRDLLMNMPVDR